MASNEKKVIAFIVEGPSDEAALGTIMEEYFADEQIRFVVIHGDITVNDFVRVDNVVSKVEGKVDEFRTKYRYDWEDIVRIIHLVDTDGAFIKDENVCYEDVDDIQYYQDHIGTNNVEGTIRRNHHKAEILLKLRSINYIHEVPYKIFYNSCNLEHVLYGELKDYTDEEKETMSDDFAEMYEGKVEAFIDFICTSDWAVQGTYAESWKHIQKGLNSLNRYTNMNLLFEQ